MGFGVLGGSGSVAVRRGHYAVHRGCDPAVQGAYERRLCDDAAEHGAVALHQQHGQSVAARPFINAFDDGTNAPTYGGINRNVAGNAAFKGQYINAGAGSTWDTKFTTASTGCNRKSMSALLFKITDMAGGETPTFGVMNPADLSTLNNDIVGTEANFVRPGERFTVDTPVRSSFPNVNVASVPIFADHFTPVANAFFVNVKYSNFYISEDAAMDFSGFQSLVPIGQIGQQGIVVFGYDFVSAKSSSGAWVYGFGGASTDPVT